jgi:hypothetical protein
MTRLAEPWRHQGRSTMRRVALQPLRDLVKRNLRRLYDVSSGAPQLHDSLHRIESLSNELMMRSASSQELLTALDATLAEVRDAQARQLRLSTTHYDDIAGLRERLRALRRTDAYEATFAQRAPLVSVPIATFNASDLLIDRAIASVQAQSYEHWEIVVVGDGCTDDTAARVEDLRDPRIRFVNLPFRTVYPESPTDRWLVSGAVPYNRAVELCRGPWIAPLDDDDEFLPKHIEILLELALERRAELVYGTLEQITDLDVERHLVSFPPELGRVGMQATLQLRSLDFFECDRSSWVVGEPVDWNVLRRMRDAGVIMAATNEVVARYYPSGGAGRS